MTIWVPFNVRLMQKTHQKNSFDFLSILISTKGIEMKLRIMTENMNSIQQYIFPQKRFHDLWSSQRPPVSERVKRNILLQKIVNLWVSTVKNCKIRGKFKFGRKVKIVASLNLGRWRIRTSPDLSWKHRVIHSYFRSLYRNFISSLK